MFRKKLVAAMASFLVIAAGAGLAEASPPSKPNIMFVIMNDVGIDRLMLFQVEINSLE
jgi:TRAP-type C4-dicarboxylate transport system permease large subunit